MGTLEERLKDTWQEHLVDALARLDGEPRARLEAQLNDIDLTLVRRLIRQLVESDKQLPYATIEPPDVIELPRSEETPRATGMRCAPDEELLAENRVAAVLVAGGQGTRLGFDGPKGALPVRADHRADAVRASRCQDRRGAASLRLRTSLVHHDLTAERCGERGRCLRRTAGSTCRRTRCTCSCRGRCPQSIA